MMILELSITHQTEYFGEGYIAGTADGIVTVNGQPVIQPIYLFNADLSKPPVLVSWIFSDKQGRYIFKHLNPNKRYIVMCRDHEQQYEPAVYDYVQPATDLTFAEQIELWNSWQNS